MDSGSYGRDDGGSDKDRLLRDYDSVIRESALLTTFTGILFGFLLTISVQSAGGFSLIDRITVLVAIFSITVAISLFVLPVVYHHLQYPYRDLEKFKERVHRFMMFGFIPTGLTLYLCLVLSLSPLISELAFIMGAIPFVLVYILFLKRK
jgi:hypothetical protein